MSDDEPYVDLVDNPFCDLETAAAAHMATGNINGTTAEFAAPQPILGAGHLVPNDDAVVIGSTACASGTESVVINKPRMMTCRACGLEHDISDWKAHAYMIQIGRREESTMCEECYAKLPGVFKRVRELEEAVDMLKARWELRPEGEAVAAMVDKLGLAAE